MPKVLEENYLSSPAIYEENSWETLVVTSLEAKAL